MSDHSHDSPRRYFVDGSGRRVLVGLTIEETSEFEALDGFATVGSCGTKAVSWVANGAVRWLELYAKHEHAWCQWMADTRANRRGNLPVVN